MYINTDTRDALLLRGMEGSDHVIRTSAELTYLFSSLVGQFLTEAPITFDRINTVIGALECAKLEAYRRIAVPQANARLTAENDLYMPVIKQFIDEAQERQAEQAIREKAAMQETA